MSKIQKPKIIENDIIDLKIIVIGNSGDGIGYVNRFAVIVKGKTKLDIIYKVRITRVLKQFAFAEIVIDVDNF